MKSLKVWILAVVALLMFCSLAHAEMRYFAVTAYNDFGESGYSEEVTCDLNRGGSVTLTWNSVDTATGYKLYWGKESGVYRPPIDTGEATTHTIIQLGSPTVTIICD